MTVGAFIFDPEVDPARPSGPDAPLLTGEYSEGVDDAEAQALILGGMSRLLAPRAEAPDQTTAVERSVSPQIISALGGGGLTLQQRFDRESQARQGGGGH